MIKNIFIPESIGDYYIFPKRILSFDIDRTHVHAVQVYLTGRTIRIEKFLEEKIEPGNATTLQDRTAQAIQNIVLHADPYHAVNAAINSSVVVFKELSLPFLEYDKIKMVINYEVEPLLPFPIAHSVIDFIITKQNFEEKTSQVLVAAILKEQLAQYLSVFGQAGVDPQVVTVDLFALYGLYKTVPEYMHETNNVALIDFGVYVTRIAFISDGQLKFIRTLSKGLINIAKAMSDELKIQPAEAMEQIMRFGLEHQEDSAYNAVMTRVLAAFWSEIDFTLRSFETQLKHESFTKLLLLGRGSEIKDICKFITTTVNRHCSLFSVTTLLQDSKILVHNGNHIPRSHIICLSAVFPSMVTSYFNLLKGDFTPADKGLFNKQMIVASALLFLILSSLLFSTFWRLHSLKSELRASNAEAVKTLKDRFKDLRGSVLKSVVSDAENELNKERQAVAFMDPTKPSVLECLMELTNRIDKQETGIKVDSITIEGDKMLLSAKVRDYPALKVLEKSLRESKMFKFNPVDTLEFTNLEIMLEPQSEEA
jgi:type IV pilus assembly protein PilM